MENQNKYPDREDIEKVKAGNRSLEETMERLTKKEMLAGHEVHFVSGDDCFCVWSEPKKFMGEAIDRLAAYEDTGLEPEEVSTGKELAEIACAVNLLKEYQDIGPVGRFQELAQAEKDGRLVVLPCKVGDEVFVDVRTLPYNYLHPEDGCIDYAKCEIVSIVTTKEETYMKLCALYLSRARRREYLIYGVTEIGKTAFLTREEAEAALKKREEGT